MQASSPCQGLPLAGTDLLAGLPSDPPPPRPRAAALRALFTQGSADGAAGGQDGGWVMARINIVTDDAVEIDANYGLAGRDMQLRMRVMKVVKGGGPMAAV